MSDYLDEHPEKVKNAGYYRRELKLVQTKLAEKDKEIEGLQAIVNARPMGQSYLKDEINSLRDKLQAIRSQEPVAYWDGKRYTHLSWSNSDPNCSTPLYAHPVIKEEK